MSNSLSELFSSIAAETTPKPKREKVTHTHSYELRLSPSGKDTYYCILPSCTHCLNIPHQIVGRKSICPGCMREFIISENKLLTCTACQD